MKNRSRRFFERGSKSDPLSPPPIKKPLIGAVLWVAEREGFEPSEPVRIHLISNQAHSATLSSLLLFICAGKGVVGEEEPLGMISSPLVTCPSPHRTKCGALHYNLFGFQISCCTGYRHFHPTNILQAAVSVSCIGVWHHHIPIQWTAKTDDADGARARKTGR